MNESFVFYKSYYEAIQCLPEDLQLGAYRAICEYAITGKEPEECDPIVKAIFKMAKPTVQSNLVRKENGKLGAKYGKLGGRPRKTPLGNNEKPLKNPSGVISKTPNENETENENVNETITTPLVGSPLNVDNFVDNSSPPQPGQEEGRTEVKIHIGKDYHVAWDDHFQAELRPLSEGQIGEIDYWLKEKFLGQDIPDHVVRSALVTKAKRENKAA